MKNIRLLIASLTAFTIGIFSVFPGAVSALALTDVQISPVMAILEPVTQPVQTILEPSLPQTPTAPTTPTSPTPNTQQPVEPNTTVQADNSRPIQYGTPLPTQSVTGVAINNTASNTTDLQEASTPTGITDTIATAQTAYSANKTSQNDRVSIAIVATIVGIILLAAGYMVRRRYEIRGVTS